MLVVFEHNEIELEKDLKTPSQGNDEASYDLAELLLRTLSIANRRRPPFPTRTPRKGRKLENTQHATTTKHEGRT